MIEFFITQIILADKERYQKTAIVLDSRNQKNELSQFKEKLDFIAQYPEIDCQVVFLKADHFTLIKRYSETRRRHPLTTLNLPLEEALKLEGEVLKPLADHADLILDTTHTNYHQLREIIRNQVGARSIRKLSILFQSFGYKSGIPLDSDFVFDARSLLNPYWIPSLRGFTGKDNPVVDFLGKDQYVIKFEKDIKDFLAFWLSRFDAENRSYLNISIGCTGGQHRSVFLVNKLAKFFEDYPYNILVRHRELD